LREKKAVGEKDIVFYDHPGDIELLLNGKQVKLSRFQRFIGCSKGREKR